MRARAPGKLVLTGAYAVLEGAPAIAIAVDRFAVADAARRAIVPTPEARQALGEGAPHCDVAQLYDGKQKLGLGSSAAALVASLGAVELANGASLAAADVRARIFAAARAAHAAVQAGGSGVDVATSTYGGALAYSIDPTTGEATLRPAALARDLVWRVYFSGKSARTSDLRGRVDRFKATHALAYEGHMRELSALAVAAADTFVEGSAAAQAVGAVRAYGESLARLGDAADVPIVPREWRTLCAAATDEGASFTPAGAGGGDVGVFCGAAAPSPAFERLARELSMTLLSVTLDPVGVCADV